MLTRIVSLLTVAVLALSGYGFSSSSKAQDDESSPLFLNCMELWKERSERGDDIEVKAFGETENGEKTVTAWVNNTKEEYCVEDTITIFLGDGRAITGPKKQILP